MADVVIFGAGDCAELAHYCLTHDSPHRAVGFTVHREYLPASGQFLNLPVVAFEELEQVFSPIATSAFAPLSSLLRNRFREEVYGALKDRGYSLISYVSSRAYTFPSTPIGENCFILENVTVQLFSSIGNNVVLWSGSHVGHHSVIGDHVFFAPHAVTAGHCTIEANCFLGTNSTIRDHVTLGPGTFVGMGAIVERDTQPGTVLKATPATVCDSSREEPGEQQMPR